MIIHMRVLVFVFVLLVPYKWVKNQSQAIQLSIIQSSNADEISSFSSLSKRRRKRNTFCKYITPSPDEICADPENVTECCYKAECVYIPNNITYSQNQQIRIRKCNSTSCGVRYDSVLCLSPNQRNFPEPTNPTSYTRAIAFSIAGLVMVALLGFAGHSISSSRKTVSQFPIPQNNTEDPPQYQVQSQPSTQPQHYYHAPYTVSRAGGKIFIGSTLSIIKEEEDVIANGTDSTPINRPNDFDDTPTSSSASGEYHQVHGAIPFVKPDHNDQEETQGDEGEVTHLEIQDLDSVQGDDHDQFLARAPDHSELYLTSSNESIHENDQQVQETKYVICDVHASPITTSETASYYQQPPSNYSLSIPDDVDYDMPEYEVASMSMFDITHTSPVRTVQRRISMDSYQYMSMPDMTKATFTIPEIDEILTSSSRRSSSCSSSSLEYCLTYK